MSAAVPIGRVGPMLASDSIPASYDEAFYSDQAPGSLQSARVVLPVVFELLRPGSLLDVGCGLGTWLSVAQDLGVPQVFGLDGDYVDRIRLEIDSGDFLAADLNEPLPSAPGAVDMALCLEVAEHLESDAADRLVRELCERADVVVFSAATPGQLGTGHINLRPQSSWVEVFKGCGYEVFDIVRPRLWGDDRVESWYRQNLLIFVSESRTDLIERARELEADTSPIMDIVHPVHLAFWVRRATAPVSTGQALKLTVSAGSKALKRRFQWLRSSPDVAVQSAKDTDDGDEPTASVVAR
jgi:SAM-dependent methyltransferase